MKLLALLVLFAAMNVAAQTKPTVAEAQDFMNKAEAQLADLVAGRPHRGEGS